MDIRTKIKYRLQKDGRTYKWLAAQFDVTRNHLYLVLNCQRDLSKKNLGVAIDIWPDIETYEPTPLPQKPLFKDDINSL